MTGLRPLVALALVVACTSPAPTAEPVAVPVQTRPPETPAPTAAGGTIAGGEAYGVAAAESKATVRIREQLVGWTAPDDAILTLDGLGGTFALRPDGTFDPASLLTGPLSAMRSDDFRRANAARETMNADRFPTVTLRPVRTEGLAMPLPASGKWTFTLVGALRVNGTERELRWETTAERAGETVKASARTAFTFGDFGMDVPRRGPVLSIVDEIRLQVDLIARAVAACAPTKQDVPANYVPGAPERSRIGAGGYVFQGVVRSSAGCGPVAGARVEVWHANRDGAYDADHRATLVAASDGRYRLDTAFPAAYGGGPSHIHIRVTAPGHRPLVSIFFPQPGSASGEMELVLEPS